MDEALQNWFSVQSSLRVYDQYLRLDIDKNGMLKKTELARYSPGLTSIFVDRIFEEYRRLGGDGLQDVFGLCAGDGEQEVAVGPAVFLACAERVPQGRNRHVRDQYVLQGGHPEAGKPGADEYKVDDLKDELWDMAKPQLPKCITLQDLINCGVGDVIVAMLTDAKAFYEYDQREAGDIEELED
eukprot:CAMPEP_0170545290 /NCGR_PEP_ID=MMETSP0211-20121228/3730_1 /TAXON_ID=311385 /ORGANISM="Pseudokeronopsis sp., Strain OXSARD2" /LENGTH=183 /DNA_ID=CAMNT_0010849147 /DNA_START=689 /DNA_END=1240 /DNA_ORIENTATION=-